MTRTERLLREIKHRHGMTHKEIVQFLLDMRDGFGRTEYQRYLHRDSYNALLYGTRDRTGVLERYCERYDDGTYHVVRKIRGPFTTRRTRPACVCRY